jgi:hypothetical protein
MRSATSRGWEIMATWLLVIAAEGAVIIARAQRSTEPLALVARHFAGPRG